MKPILLAVVSYLAAVLFNHTAGNLYPAELGADLRLLPDVRIVELLSLDHRGFAADYLFAKVNVYNGSQMWLPLELEFDSQWSYGTMDLVTELDPQYYEAYLYSGMGLIHAFSDAHLARPILDKGMDVFPESWELPFWAGYDFNTYLEDSETASGYFIEAAKKPGAPRRFFATLISAARSGGAYEGAYWAMKTLYDEEKEEKKKEIYLKKLVQLENLMFLKMSAEKYYNNYGQAPSSLDDLIRSATIEKIPEDPLGMAYSWNTEKQRVVLVEKSSASR